MKFIKKVKDYLLNYNIKLYMDDIFDESRDFGSEPLPVQHQEQFWRMVSYREHGHW